MDSFYEDEPDEIGTSNQNKQTQNEELDEFFGNENNSNEWMEQGAHVGDDDDQDEKDVNSDRGEVKETGNNYGAEDERDNEGQEEDEEEVGAARTVQGRQAAKPVSSRLSLNNTQSVADVAAQAFNTGGNDSDSEGEGYDDDFEEEHSGVVGNEAEFAAAPPTQPVPNQFLRAPVRNNSTPRLSQQQKQAQQAPNQSQSNNAGSLSQFPDVKVKGLRGSAESLSEFRSEKSFKGAGSSSNLTLPQRTGLAGPKAAESEQTAAGAPGKTKGAAGLLRNVQKKVGAKAPPHRFATNQTGLQKAKKPSAINTTKPGFDPKSKGKPPVRGARKSLVGISSLPEKTSIQQQDEQQQPAPPQRVPSYVSNNAGAGTGATGANSPGSGRKSTAKRSVVRRRFTTTSTAMSPQKRAVFESHFEEMAKLVAVVDEQKAQIKKMTEELKTSKIVCQRQEKALQQMQKESDDLPMLIHSLSEEVRILKAERKSYQEKIAIAERNSQSNIEELVRLQETVTKLNGIIKSRTINVGGMFGDHHDGHAAIGGEAGDGENAPFPHGLVISIEDYHRTSEELEKVKRELEGKDEEIKDHQRRTKHIENEKNMELRELRGKYNKQSKDMQELQAEHQKLQQKLKDKDRQIAALSIYSMKGHRAPAVSNNQSFLQNITEEENTPMGGLNDDDEAREGRARDRTKWTQQRPLFGGTGDRSPSRTRNMSKTRTRARTRTRSDDASATSPFKPIKREVSVRRGASKPPVARKSPTRAVPKDEDEEEPSSWRNEEPAAPEEPLKPTLSSILKPMPLTMQKTQSLTQQQEQEQPQPQPEPQPRTDEYTAGGSLSSRTVSNGSSFTKPNMFKPSFGSSSVAAPAAVGRDPSTSSVPEYDAAASKQSASVAAMKPDFGLGGIASVSSIGMDRGSTTEVISELPVADEAPAQPTEDVPEEEELSFEVHETGLNVADRSSITAQSTSLSKNNIGATSTASASKLSTSASVAPLAAGPPAATAPKQHKLDFLSSSPSKGGVSGVSSTPIFLRDSTLKPALSNADNTTMKSAASGIIAPHPPSSKRNAASPSASLRASSPKVQSNGSIGNILGSTGTLSTKKPKTPIFLSEMRGSVGKLKGSNDSIGAGAPAAASPATPKRPSSTKSNSSEGGYVPSFLQGAGSLKSVGKRNGTSTNAVGGGNRAGSASTTKTASGLRNSGRGSNAGSRKDLTNNTSSNNNEKTISLPQIPSVQSITTANTIANSNSSGAVPPWLRNNQNEETKTSLTQFFDDDAKVPSGLPALGKKMGSVTLVGGEAQQRPPTTGGYADDFEIVEEVLEA
ncbi:hypothetical protein HK102_004894 [Quaeritorhiza haematococci]|nr:hypothetical protein HK102_004894 [Quaeritorhiza haematococci]